MKGRTTNRRTFLGAPNCLGAIGWSTTVGPHFDSTKHPNELDMSAEIQINKDGASQYIDNRDDMKPVYRMQRELNRFIAACEEAFDKVEGHNKGLDDG